MKKLILILIIIGITAIANAESTFVELTPELSMIAQIHRRQAIADLENKLSEVTDGSLESQREKKRLNAVRVYYFIIDEYSRHFGGVLILPTKKHDIERMAEELKLLEGRAKATIASKKNSN